MEEKTDSLDYRHEQRLINRARQRLEQELSRSSIQRAIAGAVNSSKTGDSLQLEKIAQKVLSRIGKTNERALDLDSRSIIQIVSQPKQDQTIERSRSKIEFPSAQPETFSAHPWKITIRTIPESDPPEYDYAIESASRLFDGFGGTEVTVSGADGVFRNIKEGYYFIEVDFSDGNINQAQIQIDEEIGEFIETSEDDPPKQTKLRQQIGYVFFEDDVPKVRQNAWHNYTLFDACRNGVPVKVAIAT